jgi:hypothetical protein
MTATDQAIERVAAYVAAYDGAMTDLDVVNHLTGIRLRDGEVRDLTITDLRLVMAAVAAERTGSPADAHPGSPVPCPHVVTSDEGTSYCSLAEGTVLFEGTVVTTADWSGHIRLRVVAVDHQETTDG